MSLRVAMVHVRTSDEEILYPKSPTLNPLGIGMRIGLIRHLKTVDRLAVVVTFLSCCRMTKAMTTEMQITTK